MIAFITILLMWVNAVLAIILFSQIYLNKRSVVIKKLEEDLKEVQKDLDAKKKSNLRMVHRIADLENDLYHTNRSV